MKDNLNLIRLTLGLLFCAAGMVGCAATGSVQQAKATAEKPAVIELECKSANRLGCRHKGYTYPWNAWIEEMGYRSEKYEIKEVKQTDNKALVLVVERSLP